MAPMNSDSLQTASTRRQAGRNDAPDGGRLLGRETRRYALAGILFGFLFPTVATLIVLARLQLPISLSGLTMAQRADSLLWIIDTAPFFLGLFAALAGREQDALLESNKKLTEQGKELQSIRTDLESH